MDFGVEVGSVCFQAANFSFVHAAGKFSSSYCKYWRPGPTEAGLLRGEEVPTLRCPRGAGTGRARRQSCPAQPGLAHPGSSAQRSSQKKPSRRAFGHV